MGCSSTPKGMRLFKLARWASTASPTFTMLVSATPATARVKAALPLKRIIWLGFSVAVRLTLPTSNRLICSVEPGRPIRKASKLAKVSKPEGVTKRICWSATRTLPVSSTEFSACSVFSTSPMGKPRRVNFSCETSM